MKRLIVLSVIFALVAGGLFAADVGVEVFGNANIIKGSTGNTEDDGKVLTTGQPKYKAPDAGTSQGFGRIRLSASGENEEGTLGGSFRYDGVHWSGSAKTWGWVWWKPSDLIKLQIGSNAGDGEFGLDGNARWGFYAMAGEAGVASEGWVFSDSFFGGWNAPGIILTLTPIDPLTINIAVPLGTQDKAVDAFLKTTAQVKYAIDGIGTVGLTYLGGRGNHDAEYEKKWASGNPAGTYGVVAGAGAYSDPSAFQLYFGLSAIENLAVDVGIGYQLSESAATKVYSGAAEEYVTTTTKEKTNPLAVGVAANYTAGDLGVKARVQGKFLGSHGQKVSSTDPTISAGLTAADPDNLRLGRIYDLSDGYNIAFDILPSYKITDTLTFYLSAGINLTGGGEKVDLVYKAGDLETTNPITDPLLGASGRQINTIDSQLGWHINPYISVTSNVWNASFWFGIRIDNAGGAKDKSSRRLKGDTSALDTTTQWVEENEGSTYINWSIPIGITLSF